MRNSCVAALLLIVCALLIFSQSMAAHLDHDEHQFIASGALLARRGLLPYRDYPYFHTPYLVVFDALLCKLTSHLLLAARTASSVFAAACVGLVASMNFRAAEDAPPQTRWIIALVSAAMLMTNPLFLSTAGLAWNHDSSEFLLLGAIYFFLRRSRGRPEVLPMFAAGLLLGLGVGVRLTIAPLLLPFAVLAYVDAPTPLHWEALISILAGITIGLLPLAWFVAIAPQKFIFGNFIYPRLSTIYWAASPRGKYMSPLNKVLRFFGNTLTGPGTALLLLLIVFLWLAVRPPGRLLLRGHPHWRQIRLLLIVLLYVMVGAFAPTPPFPPYFYGAIPLLILLAGQLGASVWDNLNFKSAAPLWILALVAVVLRVGSYRTVAIVPNVEQWTPTLVQRQGEELRKCSPSGPVLTLAPIIPLEAGLDIYEIYATGPFAVRTAPILSRAERVEFDMPDERSLAGLLHDRPPGALLLGFEAALERRLGWSRLAFPGPTFVKIHPLGDSAAFVAPAMISHVAVGPSAKQQRGAGTRPAASAMP